MKKLTPTLLCLIVITIATAGATKDIPPQEITLSTTMAVLDTVPGFPWEQTKDGVTIKLVPVPFEPYVVYGKSLVEKPKGMLSISGGTALKYLVTDEPLCYGFNPDDLSFQLHITNHMTHVLRFAGCVVSFTADGKSLPLNTQTQDELVKSIILPQGTFDLVIKGPRISPTNPGDTTSILDNTKTIMFSIYDVTTEVDAANNPTKKATFEWIFANNPKAVSGIFLKTVTEVKLEPADAAKQNGTVYTK